MQLRKLGNSPLNIAPIAFGGNVFGWTADEKTSFALLDAFVDAGFNLIDTADVYSRWVAGNQGGESEAIIGRWLRQSGKRDRVLISTKVAKLETRRGLSAANIALAAEDSLRRLQTDTIDLYFSHEDDPATPIEETLGAYAKLIEQGKVRALGASNFTAARLSESLAISKKHDLPRYESLQPEYNLVSRNGYEAELEPLVRREQIGVISYYGLASGFLTGKYRSEADLQQSPRGRGVKKYLDARGLRILAALDEVGARQQATPTQVTLAWLIARPGITAPIVSATSVQQLHEILAATRLQLDAEDIVVLEWASA
ncbi:MAG TPA: aldo/keto reductase [Rudaea sp.]|jgi:aryl-alcohol dehydrogenase-like predicted oxidoreductase|uniref:aldo/keto reductase n=1 Tax=Rudaea sp. TaxID=2136325 RepID=UPI002F94186A